MALLYVIVTIIFICMCTIIINKCRVAPLGNTFNCKFSEIVFLNNLNNKLVDLKAKFVIYLQSKSFEAKVILKILELGAAL